VREIKFRLRIGKKVVGYERWYIGDGSNSHWEYCKNPDGKYPDNVWRPTYIYHTEKDQYVGLKDKNKKEIYEEDLLESITVHNQGRIFKVLWHQKENEFADFRLYYVHDHHIYPFPYGIGAGHFYKIAGGKSK